MWNSGGFTSLMLPHIANDAGMDEQATAETMARFVLPREPVATEKSFLGTFFDVANR
jgi:taurine transport system substrate-binding protein